MSTSAIHQELEEIVRKLMEEKGIEKYKLKIEGQSTAGDNYMGVIVFFKILTENNDTIFDMVMKTAKRSEELRKSVPLEHAYNRELYMYSEVFPEFRKFLKEVNPDFEFDFIPKVHWIAADQYKETLIFANLKAEGFKLRDRRIPWNLQHSLFAMEHYGKYHAISLALKDQRAEIFESMSKNLYNVNIKIGEKIDLEGFYAEPIRKIMDLLEKNGRKDLVGKYDGFVKKAMLVINGEIDDVDKIVITHGDCWNNNFMFKYQNHDETKPSKMCFLDFQISSLSTPIIDLSYNIFASCDKSVLVHLDQLLDTYYNSLSKTLKSLGSNPDVLFTYEQCRNHWRKYSSFGVLFACILVRLQLTEPEDAPDMAKGTEEGKSLEETFGEINLKDEAEFNRRILEVFTFYGDNFL